jgi:hypothetical protein
MRGDMQPVCSYQLHTVRSARNCRTPETHPTESSRYNKLQTHRSYTLLFSSSAVYVHNTCAQYAAVAAAAAAVSNKLLL